MELRFTSKFDKQFDALRDASLRSRVMEAVRHVYAAASVRDIPNLKKLTGYRTAYRIKMGDYRIGLHIENEVVSFSAIDHRKQIYRSFPVK